jgi:beta-glucanase (GH16 family)
LEVKNKSLYPLGNDESTLGTEASCANCVLVWEELFSSNRIDKNKWNYVEGGWGFGNQELQYYTNREDNARIEDGMLILEARKEKYMEMEYTSAKLTTKGKASWKYGRFSIRAKLPEGQGIWPAIWMMPVDMECYSDWTSTRYRLWNTALWLAAYLHRRKLHAS